MHRTDFIPAWFLPGAMLVYASVTGGGSTSVAALFFLGSIFVMGLPHGGCDPWLPRWLGAGNKHWFVALVLYMALAACVLVLWLYLPGAALGAFLLVTAWHWGDTDAGVLGQNKWWGWGRGLFIVGAATGWQPELTRPLFQSITAGSPFCESVIYFAGWCAFFGLGLEGIGLLVSKSSYWRWLVAETLLIAALCWLANPLLAITTYFVGLHSPRSMGVTLPWLPIAWQKHRLAGFHVLALPGALITLLAMPWCASLVTTTPHVIDRAVGAYFILLAILTPSHAILFTILKNRQPIHLS